MEGGEIYKNHASYGGGIYSTATSGEIWITGGSITGNTADTKGGGVYIAENQVALKDSPIIKDNTVNDKNNNLAGTKSIDGYNPAVRVRGTLSNSASIGIDPSVGCVVFVLNEGNATNDQLERFECDDSSYQIYLTSSYIKFGVKPKSVTLTGGTNATPNGATEQTNLTGAMTTVTYTANEGYYFASFEDIVDGDITATRTNSTTVTVSGTPTADVSITIPNAIEKTESSVTTEPSADTTLKYDGNEKNLLTSVGVAEGGTIYYAVTDTNAAPGESAYSASVPKKTNAGTYYVWYKVVGDEGHYNTAAVDTPVEVTIAKADALSKENLTEEQEPSGEDQTYTGSEIALLTAPSSLPAGYTEVLYKIGDEEWSNGIPERTAPGTYTVKVKYTGNNYADLVLDDIVVKIEPVDKSGLNTAIATAQAYLGDIENITDYEAVKTALSTAISTAQTASNDTATTSEVTEAINNLNLALNKAKYDVCKVDSKKAADGKGQTGDSDASKALINAAKSSIDNKAYDESKTFDLNKKAIDDIITKLNQDLTDQRAADAVTKLINDLPATDEITTDKETVINQAKEAFDALTPAQQSLVNQDAKDKLQAAADAALVLAETKKAAKDALDADYNGKKNSGAYDQEGLEALNSAYDAAVAAIDAATVLKKTQR